MALELETPSLDAGDNLTRDRFLAIWEQMPDIKFAELIGGIVYMPSPLRIEHGSGDRRISTWLGVYEAHTPVCGGGSNVTVRSSAKIACNPTITWPSSKNTAATRGVKST